MGLAACGYERGLWLRGSEYGWRLAALNFTACGWWLAALNFAEIIIFAEII
jgi:hypothetical protein